MWASKRSGAMGPVGAGEEALGRVGTNQRRVRRCAGVVGKMGVWVVGWEVDGLAVLVAEHQGWSEGWSRSVQTWWP